MYEAQQWTKLKEVSPGAGAAGGAPYARRMRDLASSQVIGARGGIRGRVERIGASTDLPSQEQLGY